MFLLSNNQTTIGRDRYRPREFDIGTEYHQYWKYCRDYRRRFGKKEKVSIILHDFGRIMQALMFPYDLGVVQNLKQTLGDNIWSWLLPTPPSGNGIDWKVSRTYQGDPVERRSCSDSDTEDIVQNAALNNQKNLQII